MTGPEVVDPGRLGVVERVVGIGSSAGGLEALQALVGGLAAGSGCAFVVAQHLAPDHPSLIVDLLARVSVLPVLTVTDGQSLEPDVVLVCPPGKDVTVDGGVARVGEPAPGGGPNPGIDRLFDSIASSWGPRAVGVVLSGTGADGSHGLRAIRAAEGLTIVQAPESAKFDAMPRAAIALGVADLVVVPEDVAPKLARTARAVAERPDGVIAEPDLLGQVCAVLRRATGVDFSGYKESTLSRQVARRMVLRPVGSVADYLPLLVSDAGEAGALMSNLLVTVTSFFRDPAAFEALGVRLRSYMVDRPQDFQFRVWVPGCATGEEAYSVAMLVADVLGHPLDLRTRLKVFATDLDEPALTLARRGVYPTTALERVPADLRARYVVEGPNGPEITTELRECTVFAHHNVAEDPPFPRLDLVSCRNTLIYFRSELQERVLHAFRYALLPGGLLFLGAMETVGAGTPGFAVVDPVSRLYARTAELVPNFVPSGPAAVWVPPTPRPRPAPPGRVPQGRDAVPADRFELFEALLQVEAAPCLVLDSDHELVEVIGDVSPYCRVPPGRASAAALAFLRPQFQAEARAVLLMARAESGVVLGRVMTRDVAAGAAPGAAGSVRLRARQLRVGMRDLLVLSFLTAEGAAETSPQASRDSVFDAELERLERDLLVSQDSLRRSLAELETTNEELQASTEELQGSAEELQASYEELETSNEELQATNEELGALNSALRLRGEQLHALIADLENIQSSLSQGMVLLDADLRVTRFTPLAVRVFAMVDSDIGTPLLRVPTTLPVPGLADALHEVVAGSDRRSLELAGDNVSYLAQVLPYQAGDGVRRGAILTLTDVTEMAALRRDAEAALADFTRVTDALDEVVWKQDATTGEMLYVSPRIEALTGLTPAQWRSDPGSYQERISPADRDRVAAARQAAGKSWALTYQVIALDGTRRWVAEEAAVVSDPGGDFIVGTLSDITDRRRAEQRAADQSMVFESVFRNRAFGVAILGRDARIVEANKAFAELVGQSTKSVVGMPIHAFSHPEERDTGDLYVAMVAGGTTNAKLLSRRLLHHDGSTRWVLVDLRPLPRPVGDAAAVAVYQDITSLHEKSEALTSQARFDSLTGLLNRATVREVLEREISHSQRIRHHNGALMWIDLDHFKEVNDRDGHHSGDRVLATIAERLTSVTRKDEIVGRLGGDEFAVVLTGYELPSELDIALDRILAAVREPIDTEQSSARVTASIGVALFPHDGATAEDVIRAADTAMYEAKSRGGDEYVYFHAGMNTAAEIRRRSRAKLSKAVAENAFQLYYQPIVRPGGAIWGAEALIRWNQEDRVVPAAEFIGFAEESGLIRALTPITLKLLNADLAALRDAGYAELPVTFNMSVTQLADRHLADQLSHWPAPKGLAGLTIEVTESVFLPDNAPAFDLLEALRRLGASICVDDYGSGFSNLLRLKSLSPDFIKLDRSLICPADNGPAGLPTTLRVDPSGSDVRDTALLATAIEMGHALGATVVAEGLETDDQIAALIRLDADLLQGFAIAEPMPLPALLTWLDQHD